MINVILTYSQTKEFTEDSQKIINDIQLAVIPEMRTVYNFVEDEIVSKTIPYQANVTLEQFDILVALLEANGVIDIIGKWNVNDGSKIELDINKYRDALNDVKTFEDVNVMGTQTNEDGIETEIVLRTFTGLKESKCPTLSQARLTQVNTFNSKVKRQLV